MTLPKADSQAWLLITKVTRSTIEAARKFIHSRTVQRSCWIPAMSMVTFMSITAHRAPYFATFPGVNISSKTSSSSSGIVRPCVGPSMFTYIYLLSLQIVEGFMFSKEITNTWEKLLCESSEVVDNTWEHSFDFNILLLQCNLSFMT